VTLQGTHFASRVASSLLAHLGLEELVAHSLQEFEDIAVKLALDRKFLIDTKAYLAKHIEERLFNTSLFVAQLENAYLRILERYLNDLAPEAIWLESNLEPSE
jgi:predicted O-linked N-acetylglucosamine transferase (SPINDLY family)